MPQYLNPHKGMVIITNSHGNTVRIMPGSMVDCAESIALRCKLTPVTSEAPKAVPAIRPPITPPSPPAPIIVKAPVVTKEPEIIPAPPPAPVVEEPKPIGVPIPATEPTVEDKGKKFEPAVIPEPAIPPTDETTADEIAKSLLKSAGKPKHGKKAKGETE